ESLRDPLTGLLNRRTLDDALMRMVAFARRSGHPLSLLMLDLDHFKRVNDTHGHEAGDAVLKAFASVLSGSLRASDMAVRYGGEEFLAVLPDTGTDAALGVAEKLRRAVENLAIPMGEAVVRPTVSIGVATLAAGESGEALIGRADRALYRAKGEGRNRAAVG
ncbi:MAG: GGDEF domain-containing protein, partial [Candidatus Sericytochromatia bacterium]